MPGTRSSLALALPAAALLLLPATALAERPYDRDVAKTIDAANSALGKFVSNMDDKAKRAQITRDGVTTDVSDYFKDFKAEGQRLNDRFGSGDAANQNALDFLKRGATADRWFATHPGFSGAEGQWAGLVPHLQSLAAAYQIDWTADLASWRPVRSTDAQIKKMLDGLDRTITGAGKAVTDAAKAAKVDRAAATDLKNATKELREAGKTLRTAFGKREPVSAHLERLRTNAGRIAEKATALGVADAAKAGWSPLERALGELAIALDAG